MRGIAMQTALDARTIAAQTLMEHRTLEYVKQALRVTVQWDLDSVGADRKLSSVRFIAESLQRHLLRLMELEESGGYMQAVVEEKPHLANQIVRLRADHEVFRRQLAVLPICHPQTDELADETLSQANPALLAFLDKLDEHDRRETNLIQIAFCEDDGGEG
jgi:hypothetical protein